MNDIAPIAEPRSIIADMARQYGMDRRAFESTMRNTIMPAKTEVSNEQLAAFAIVAKRYALNPFTKEIFAFPAKGGGIQPIVSIDGWLKIINDHPQFNGMEFDDKFDDKAKLIAVTCRIFRKDRDRPVEVTEYMSECARGTEPWNKWPARMLRHKATIQAARYAFGFSGIVDPDEAERIESVAPATAKPAVVAMPRAKSATTQAPESEHLPQDYVDDGTRPEPPPTQPAEPGIYVSESLEAILLENARMAHVSRDDLLARYPHIDHTNYNAIREQLKSEAAQ